MLRHEHHVIKESDFNSEFNAPERPEELELMLNDLGGEGWRVIPLYVGLAGCYLIMQYEVIAHEYYVIKGSDFNSAFNAKERPQELENILNDKAKKGWRVVPVYLGANECHILMERQK